MKYFSVEQIGPFFKQNNELDSDKVKIHFTTKIGQNGSHSVI